MDFRNQSKIFMRRYKQSCNSKGLLSGSDVSKLIMFLISDDSSYIHGQNFIIDDGWSLWKKLFCFKASDKVIATDMPILSDLVFFLKGIFNLS